MSNNQHKTINTVEEYIQELTRITHQETGTPFSKIRINKEVAQSWFDDGIPPYYCFREMWEGDGEG